MARAKDTKERMAGVERLHELLEASRKSLSSSEVTSLVDCCLDLLKDNNFRVSQGGLQALDSAAVLSGEHLKLHFNALVPATVERLGDAKQPVRDAARRLLLTLMQVRCRCVYFYCHFIVRFNCFSLMLWVFITALFGDRTYIS